MNPIDEPRPTAPAPPDAGLPAWWRQGLRSALLRPPDWAGLRATPARVAALLAADLLAVLVLERLSIVGAATFYPPALLTDGFATGVAAWACWGLRPAQADPGQPGAAALFALLAAQALTITLAGGSATLLLLHGGVLGRAGDQLLRWGLGVLPLVWSGLAIAVLFARAAPPRRALPALVAAALIVGSLGLQQAWQPLRHWYAVADAQAAVPAPPRLTQQAVEAQPALLHDQLQALAAGRPGVVDVYSITFAPYADEDVFRRESAMVSAVIRDRYGADGRSVQLVNHRDTALELPWATATNLRRAIDRIARLMDKDEDVLFIHLTSHGARNGELAAEFAPLALDPVTPQLLKSWLDDAGVRYRVLSVSACYSGSWVEPLAGPGTLVMTAADATHTSYGCGRGSQFTYFGRAMFNEELRRTWSFEQAHAAARRVIERREHDAGKADGFSNPQIRVGAAIAPLLRQLELQQAASPPPPDAARPAGTN